MSVGTQQTLPVEQSAPPPEDWVHHVWFCPVSKGRPDFAIGGPSDGIRGVVIAHLADHRVTGTRAQQLLEEHPPGPPVRPEEAPDA